MDVFKWQSRAIASIACYTAYSFPSVFFSGLSYLFFYTVSSRYLYLSIGSISICPNENLDCSLVLPIVRDRFFFFSELDMVYFGYFVGNNYQSLFFFGSCFKATTQHIIHT